MASQTNINNFYMLKIDSHLLVSSNPSGSIFLQSMLKPYEITNVLRVIIDISSKSLIYKTIHRADFKSKQFDLILLKYWDDSSGPIFHDNVEILNMAWSADLDDGIDCFLSFFVAGSFLSFHGEYGTEIVTFLPFIYFLYCNDLLGNRTISTYNGMNHYYNFLSHQKIFQRNEERIHFNVYFRFPTPNIDEHGARKSRFEMYGNLCTEYSHGISKRLDCKKPLIFIQNKFCVEWNEGPINYLPLNLLDHLFGYFSEKYHIIYSRPGISVSKDYSKDANVFCDYPDTLVAAKHNIKVLENMDFENYNKTKIEILSSAAVFIGVQGGGSYLAAFYNSLNIFILHLKGDELKYGAYEETGFFGYMNNNTSKITVAHDYHQLWQLLMANL